MRSMTTVIAAFFVCLAFTNAQAGVLISVPKVGGSTSTQAFGINNKNVVVGIWHDKKGVEHAFFGTLDGNYTLFDYTAKKVKGTGAFGIDDAGNVVGTASTPASSCGLGYSYFRKPDGTILTISRKGAITFGGMQGVSNKTSVGSYYDAARCKSFGLLATNGKYKKDLPVGSSAFPTGINSAGVIVGSFAGSDDNSHGFRLQNGTMTRIDFPNPAAEQTFLYAISDSGMAVGDWEDEHFNDHGFVLDLATNTFTALHVPGVSNPRASGVNSKGFLVVTGSTGQTFVYCPLKPAKCPAKGKAMSIYGASIQAPPGNVPQ